MPAHPTTVSLRSAAVTAPTTKTECFWPGKRYGRSFLQFSALAPAVAIPSPRAIADVREPPGVFTRRLPPHHWR
jgi:hypothetical protein